MSQIETYLKSRPLAHEIFKIILKEKISNINFIAHKLNQKPTYIYQIISEMEEYGFIQWKKWQIDFYKLNFSLVNPEKIREIINPIN